MCSAGRVEAVLNGVADVEITVARAARIRAVLILRAFCLMECKAMLQYGNLGAVVIISRAVKGV